MKGNSDRQMANDFDQHLKQVMSSLSSDIKKDKNPNNKQSHIIKARR